MPDSVETFPIIFLQPGPNWKKDVAFPDQPYMKEHVSHYKTLHQRGKITAGGPFLDDEGAVMLCSKDETVASAQKMAADDPAVKRGVLLFEIRAWYHILHK